MMSLPGRLRCMSNVLVCISVYMKRFLFVFSRESYNITMRWLGT